MSELTQNLNLNKPAGLERFNLNDWNSNMDKIDSAVGNLKENAQCAKVIQTTEFPTSDIQSYPTIYSVPKVADGPHFLWKHENDEWVSFTDTDISTVKFVNLTQAQYDVLDKSERIKGIVFFVED